MLILLPFWTSVLVRSYAWMVLMGRHGLINEALTAAGALQAGGNTIVQSTYTGAPEQQWKIETP